MLVLNPRDLYFLQGYYNNNNTNTTTHNNNNKNVIKPTKTMSKLLYICVRF